MRTDDEIKADFDFVVAELLRFGKMEWEELAPLIPEHGLHEIQDAAGGKRIIGRFATRRLFQLAEEALDSSTFRGRVDPERAYRAVSDGLGKAYIHADYKEPTGAELRERLSEWIAEAGGDCASRTYFIPCNIGIPRDRTVVLGPLTLRSHKTTWEVVSERLAAYVAGDEEDSTFRRDNAETAERYYRVFMDVAEVTVPACDAPTSKRVANEAVQAALDILHVLGGAAYTSHMRGGGPPIDDRRGELVIDADGELTVNWSRRFGGAQFAEEWWEWLDRPERAGQLQALGRALTTIVERREPELIAARFLDGAAWYGDAAREPSPAAAVVKYILAMERLLWADDKSDSQSKRIAARAAALCFRIDSWNFEEMAQEVKTAYDLRSDIIHGRIPRGDPKVTEGLRVCERVSRDLVQIWLERYWEGFDKSVTLERVREHLDGFVKEVREEDQKRRREEKRKRRRGGS